ncbi:MAG: hypothetical protein ABSD28_06005 [Tepidisphaeraceae bacterium]|jgi:hypothetical protein
MEPLEAVEALAHRARAETPPRTNVDIGAIVRAARAEPQWRLTPLAWSAAVSALAACAILSLALRSTGKSTTADSITPLFNAAQVQMP